MNMEGRQWNRISSWEEPVEIEGLTLWDINRPNHDMIVSDEKITVEKRKIDDGLHCPVCMLILKKTKVVMTCLHRFCEECIDKCLRLNKNECPACRAHVPSRRSLRYDENFDELISTLFGDIEEADKAEMMEVKRINAKTSQNPAYKLATKKGLEVQEKMRKRGKSGNSSSSNNNNNKRSRSNIANNSDGSSSSSGVTSQSSGKRQKVSHNNNYNNGHMFGRSSVSQTLERKPAMQHQRQLQQHRRPMPNMPLVQSSQQFQQQQQRQHVPPPHQQRRAIKKESRNMEFILERHPDETFLKQLDRSFLRTDSNIPVRVLKKYLKIKLQSADHIQFHLSLKLARSRTERMFIDLDDQMTMESAVERHNFDKNKEVTLYYRLLSSSLSSTEVQM